MGTLKTNSQSNRPVPSNKPRIQAYVTSESYEKIKEEAARTGYSISKWIENNLELMFSDELVVIRIDPEKLKKIKQLAGEGYRSVPKWVESNLELMFSDESVIIKIDPEKLKKIKQLAEEGYRSVDDQIQLLIDKGLQD